MMIPTGRYRGCKHWPAVVKAAGLRTNLKTLAKNYLATGHPGALNAIMDNADANLWLTYYTGRITEPS